MSNPSSEIDPNKHQVGGNHYKNGDKIQHWDFTWENGYDQFQYIITKWVHRWKDKGGLEDLRKARHALDKYIDVIETAEQESEDSEMMREMDRYTNQ